MSPRHGWIYPGLKIQTLPQRNVFFSSYSTNWVSQCWIIHGILVGRCFHIYCGKCNFLCTHWKSDLKRWACEHDLSHHEQFERQPWSEMKPWSPEGFLSDRYMRTSRLRRSKHSMKAQRVVSCLLLMRLRVVPCSVGFFSNYVFHCTMVKFSHYKYSFHSDTTRHVVTLRKRSWSWLKIHPFTIITRAIRGCELPPRVNNPPTCWLLWKKCFQFKVSEMFEFLDHHNICVRFGFVSINGRLDTQKTTFPWRQYSRYDYSILNHNWIFNVVRIIGEVLLWAKVNLRQYLQTSAMQLQSRF